MFNSNFALLQLTADVSTKSRKIIGIKDIVDLVETLKFDSDVEISELSIDNCDKRTFAIKMLFKTEKNYIKKIQLLLTDVFSIFKKESKKVGKKLINSSDVISLYQYFPTIYDIHYNMNIELRDAIEKGENIGHILVKYLSKDDLLNCYIEYVEKCTNYLEICLNVRSGDTTKFPFLNQLEQIIMLPIQRFPQFECAIGEIYSNTPSRHSDKVQLFRALNVVKSISLKLDRARKLFDSRNCKELFNKLKKLKVIIESKRLFSKNSVHYLVFDGKSKQKEVQRIPYYLLLCDREIILYPKDTVIQESENNQISVYPTTVVDFQFKNIFNIKNVNDEMSELEKSKLLLQIVRDPLDSMNIVEDCDELINDYNILTKINENVGNLNFRYSGLEPSCITKSILDLEEQLNLNQREINRQLNSILTLTIKQKKSDKSVRKIFQFDSISQANSWKMSFYRTKLLLDVRVISNWWLNSIKSTSIELTLEELPLLYPEFVINKNVIVNMTSSDIIYVKLISIIVGSKILRCIWCYLQNGLIIIMHFDYCEWSVLESIEEHITKKTGCLSCACTISSLDLAIANVTYDSEIWLATNEKICVFSLLDNQRSRLKIEINLPDRVLGMVYVHNRMLICLRNMSILVYTPTKLARWLHESTIKLKQYNDATSATNFSMDYFDVNSIYIILKNCVFLLEYQVNNYRLSNNQSFPASITAHHILEYGVWLAFEDDRKICLYNRRLETRLQSFEIAEHFMGCLNVSQISAMHCSDKYMWLGSDKGLIMCVSMMDLLYHDNTTIPVYVTLTTFKKEVTNFLTFQNVHGVTAKSKVDMKDFGSRRYQNPRSTFKRTLSIPMEIDSFTRGTYNFPKDSKYPPMLPKNETSSHSRSSSMTTTNLEGLQRITPNLVLAFGNGLGKISYEKKKLEVALRILSLNLTLTQFC